MCTERTHGMARRAILVLAGSMALALICFSGCASTMYQSSGDVQAEVDDVQYLSSYGEWVYIEPFGTVWRPGVVAGWEPFYYGHWIWTSNGWAWTSYEPYGWLVFHYGYWGYQPGIGWFWVPGDTWYPARVHWYTFGNYTAWAPIPPPGVVWPDPWDPYDVNIWIVVDIDNFTNEDIGRHRIVRPIARETVRDRTIVKRAPEIREVEKVMRKKVPVVNVREQPAKIRSRTAPEQPASAGRAEPRLKKMVLPEKEKRRVEKRASQVEREVLQPRKAAPAPPRKSAEDKKDTTKKKKR